MGLFKKKTAKKSYDKAHMKPVIRASICTGEQVAGFKDIQTGKIKEIMLIKCPEDLENLEDIFMGKRASSIELSNEEREYLELQTRARTIQAQTVTRARILLLRADSLRILQCRILKI